MFKKSANTLTVEEMLNNFGNMPMPKKGWIKSFRNLMGINGRQMSLRMDVSIARISQMEKMELEKAVTLKTMVKAAHALDCEFVYAFVPKKPLTEILDGKSREMLNETFLITSNALDKQEQNEPHENTIKDKFIEESLNTEEHEILKKLLNKAAKQRWIE